MKQTLIAMQYWKNDEKYARRVTELMARVEPAHRDDVTLMLAHRFDCPAPDEAWVKTLARKFDVVVHKGRRYGTGWPHGPNELWFDVLSKFWEDQRWGKVQHQCMLTLEPDDVPLHADWIDRIYDEWQTVGRPAIFGSLQEFPGWHINGNLLVTGDVAALGVIGRIAGCPPNRGWDYHLAPVFKKLGWSDSKTIRSFWATRTMDPAEIKKIAKSGCVLLHGVKDESVLNFSTNLLTRVPRKDISHAKD